MSYGPNAPAARTCPHCGAAVVLLPGPLAGPAAGPTSRKNCLVCHADLDAPGDPGSATVEAMLSVLGGITGSPFTGEKPPKKP